MIYKAITLYQPWASLVAVGAKKYETRGWKTNYRGPIAIHAGIFNPSFEQLVMQIGVSGIRKMRAALRRAGINPGEGFDDLIRGVVVATAELVGCYEIGYHAGGRTPPGKISVYAQTENELFFGDWTPGRFAWELTNVRMLPEPIPAKGRQGLWNWEG